MLLDDTKMGLRAFGLIQARQLARSDPRQSLGLMTGAFGARLGDLAELRRLCRCADRQLPRPLAGKAAAALVIAAALVGLPHLAAAGRHGL